MTNEMINNHWFSSIFLAIELGFRILSLDSDEMEPALSRRQFGFDFVWNWAF